MAGCSFKDRIIKAEGGSRGTGRSIMGRLALPDGTLLTAMIRSSDIQAPPYWLLHFVGKVNALTIRGRKWELENGSTVEGEIGPEQLRLVAVNADAEEQEAFLRFRFCADTHEDGTTESGDLATGRTWNTLWD